MTTIDNHTGVPVTDNSNIKTHSLVAYVLMIIGLFTAIPLFIGAIWAMFTRKSSVGTVYHSHYSNAIRVFWWSLLWGIVGWITAVFVIGFAILGIAWLWAIYRLVYGLAKILSDEPYPL